MMNRFNLGFYSHKNFDKRTYEGVINYIKQAQMRCLIFWLCGLSV